MSESPLMVDHLSAALTTAKSAIANELLVGARIPSIYDSVDEITRLYNDASLAERERFTVQVGKELLPIATNMEGVEVVDTGWGCLVARHNYHPCYAAKKILELVSTECGGAVSPFAADWATRAKPQHLLLVANIPPDELVAMLTDVCQNDLGGMDFFERLAFFALEPFQWATSPLLIGWLLNQKYEYYAPSVCMLALDHVVDEDVAAVMVHVICRRIKASANYVSNFNRFHEVHTLVVCLRAGLPILEKIVARLGPSTLLDSDATEVLSEAIDVMNSSAIRTRLVTARLDAMKRFVQELYAPSVRDGKLLPPVFFVEIFETENFSGSPM